ncbi:MAG TPA: ABC transporter permease [Vicinamibacterales bacterium]|nr:ABC transporter permease [Vicinamibacterales bacterium]
MKTASLTFDLKDCLRGLRRDWGYAATVVLTLALTIGGTTAVFSIVEGVLYRPLAYAESQRLVAVREVVNRLSNVYPSVPVNAHHFAMWRDQAQSFESLAELVSSSMNLTGHGEPMEVHVIQSSGALFDVLRAQAAAGRLLNNGDESDPEYPHVRGGPNVVVISEALWRDRFGRDPAVVGQAIALDGLQYVVVGVLPKDVRLPEPSDPTTGRLALSARVDAVVPIPLAFYDVGWDGDYNFTVVGRLKDGVDISDARAELGLIQTRVSASASERTHMPVAVSAMIAPLSEAIVGGARRGLLLLLAAITAVLLIACTNLANLSLTRTLGRFRDAAIRTALGASRGRLVSRIVLEQILLAGAGGLLGIGVAFVALLAFVQTAPIDLPRVHEVAIDRTALTFSAAITLLTGLLVGLAPAWRLAGRDVQAALRAGGLGTTTDAVGLRARSALLTVQVALSVTLVVFTALLAVSLRQLVQTDRGFVTDRVLTAAVRLPAAKYGEAAARVAAYDRVLAAVHALPGVAAVSWASILPLRGETWMDGVAVEGDVHQKWERPTANYRFVSPEFFDTLGMPIRRGHAFTETDRDPNRPAPALISERTAERAWPGQDPVGKRFSRGWDVHEQPFEVVGVVADARTTALDRRPPMMVYVPYWWRSRASAALMVRTAAAPAGLAAALRRTVWSVDAEAAVGDVRPLETLVDDALASRRYQVTLFVTFGVAALAIALVGIYAVTSYGVSRRRREMNIRVALGAQKSEVVRMIVRQAAVPIVSGTVAGAFGAIVTGGVFASLLFGVQPRDPRVISAVVAVVGTVGLLSCLIAAWQGLHIDAASALREE